MSFDDIKQKGRATLIALRNAAAHPGQVIDGFSNLFLSELHLLPQKEQEAYAGRYERCINCSIRVGNVCDPNQSRPHAVTGEIVHGCGCNLAASTKSPRKSCPAGEWDAINPDEL